ncbi:hypothetical protein KQS31_001250 [Campylobacter upsaliensis]|nr:hypothetical protein [Campylobacter upsaliensis]
MSKPKKLHKKARLNLTPFVWRRRKVKQGQARSSKVKQGGSCVRSLEREFIKQGKANSPEATRQIYAKRQGKFKAKS